AARFHGDGAGASAARAEVIPRQHDRRRDGEVRREHAGSRGWRVRDDQREVEPIGGGLDAAVDARRAEARGGGESAFYDVDHRCRTRTDSVAVRGWAARRLVRLVVMLPTAVPRSGSATAYCPHVRNFGQAWQSVAIFSGSQVCGTMVKPSRTKCAASCVKAQ